MYVRMYSHKGVSVFTLYIFKLQIMREKKAKKKRLIKWRARQADNKESKGRAGW